MAGWWHAIPHPLPTRRGPPSRARGARTSSEPRRRSRGRGVRRQAPPTRRPPAAHLHSGSQVVTAGPGRHSGAPTAAPRARSAGWCVEGDHPAWIPDISWPEQHEWGLGSHRPTMPTQRRLRVRRPACLPPAPRVVHNPARGRSGTHEVGQSGTPCSGTREPWLSTFGVTPSASSQGPALVAGCFRSGQLVPGPPTRHAARLDRAGHGGRRLSPLTCDYALAQEDEAGASRAHSLARDAGTEAPAGHGGSRREQGGG